MSSSVESLVQREYKYGFVTDIESDVVPKGLSEDIVRLISAKKGEPEWLLEWRLKAYRGWLKMQEPHWPNVTYPPIDYQDLSYYAAPKTKTPLGSLDDADPKLLETYAKLGIPLSEQKLLVGVAVDAIFDSVSVGTTYKAALAEQGIIFCSFSEAVKEHPELVQKYLASVVPASDNFFAALNSAVFTDGSFVYVPKGVRCPMELSTYFRINEANTGQFERTLIIADEGAHVSYLEGCTAPKRDENQLHAAVVELVALEGATIKYSTVQNWYAGDEKGVGGIYNFVTKRGKAMARAKISWTQVETGSSITWKYPSVILQGGGGEREAASRHRHQDDPHREEHEEHDRVQGHQRGAGEQQLPRAGEGAAQGGGRPELHPVRLDADREPLRGAHLPLHRRAERVGGGGARGLDVQDRRGPDLLLQAAGHEHGERHLAHRERLLQGSLQGAADGVRGGSAEAAGRFTRGECGMSMLEVKDLTAAVGEKEILRGVSLTVNAGEVHAIMGPNGSGKSTLAQVLAGHPVYEVTGGQVLFEGEDLLELDPEERAWKGIFLAFQYPVEIPGVTNAYFLRAAYNEMRKARGLEELDPMDFLDILEEKLKVVEWGPEIMSRFVNHGFSGGEKKRNEILQMAVLDPKLAILDETDSGLDIDALRIVAGGVNKLRRPDNATIVVTHYQRLLNYIVPDFVHVLVNGRIVKSGGKELALELEARGYEWMDEDAPAGAGAAR
jgi:FeS assembly protein SufB/FeS assembly ATPase SufC